VRVELVDPTSEQIAQMIVDLIGDRNKSHLASALGVARETMYRWMRPEEHSIPDVTTIGQLAHETESEVILRFNSNDGPTDLEALRNTVVSLQARVSELEAEVQGTIRLNHSDA